MANDMERIIKMALIKLGVKCDLVGFLYLTKAIELVIADPMQVYNLKGLFADVADFYNIDNPIRIEANVQNAISFAYNNGGLKNFETLFGMKVIQDNQKPSTAQFIKLVAEYYQMGLYKAS